MIHSIFMSFAGKLVVVIGLHLMPAAFFTSFEKYGFFFQSCQATVAYIWIRDLNFKDSAFTHACFSGGLAGIIAFWWPAIFPLFNI
jgi:hypothetical protein